MSARLPEEVRVVRDAIAHVDGLRSNTDGMLTYESAEKVAAAALAAYPACVPAEHSAATRLSAFREAEQLMRARWLTAWDEWARLVPTEQGAAPSDLCRRSWARMEQALDDYEAVAALAEEAVQ